MSELSLPRLLDFNDRFRRVYPPDWEGKGTERMGVKMPAEFAWEFGDKSKNRKFPLQPESDFRQFVRTGAEPTMALWWAELILPLVPYAGGKEADDDPKCFPVRQLEDERIPSMSFIAVDDPREVSRGDTIRLALLDDSGDPDQIPYSRSYLARFEQDCCYDAFWEPSPAKPPIRPRDLPALRDDLSSTGAGRTLTMPTDWLHALTTEWAAHIEGKGPWTGPDWLCNIRYMCCGYGFTMLGRYEDGGKASFFMDHGQNHFRNHYFKLGLIAHFHRVSLLMFSYRLSDAVKLFASDGQSRPKEFRDKVQQIQRDFLRFRSRYWFTEVSNHVQAKALFDLWSRQLGNRELFDQVLDEIRTVNDVLNAQEQEYQTAAANRQTAAANRLTIVATFGLALSLTLTSLQLGGTWPFVLRLILVLVGIFILIRLVIHGSIPLSDCFSSWAERGEPRSRRVIEEICDCFSGPPPDDSEGGNR